MLFSKNNSHVKYLNNFHVTCPINIINTTLIYTLISYSTIINQLSKPALKL
jgi:hypothetical protein